MSYHERRALISVLSTIVIIVLYSAYMGQRYPQAEPYSPEVFHYWGAFFLILIPVTVIAKILVMIMFSIVNVILTREADPIVSDERDNLIELRAIRSSQYVFGIGVILAMGALVMNQPPATMFILLICAGVVTELVSDMSQFFLYRRGF